MKRRLMLHRATLTELTSDELMGIDGADGIEVPPPTPVVNTLPLNHCIGTFDCVVTLRINCFGAG